MKQLVDIRWATGVVAIVVMSLADASATAGGRADSGTLRAGAAAVDITPPAFPVVVNGYFNERIATAAHDRMMARCLVLDDGAERIAIVVVDSLMIPRSLLDEAKQMAQTATGVPTDRMLISATHTHSAPSVMGCLGSGTDVEYSRFLPGQIARSIVQAIEQLTPAEVGWAVVTDDQHNHCRRWILRPDRMPTDPFGVRNVRAHMHPGHMSENHIGPSGPADTDLSLLSVRTAEGKPLAVLANYAMHYYGSPMVSGDFCGRFGTKFAELIGVDRDGTNGDGPAFVGIMSQGTSGDSMWPDYSQPATPSNLEAYTAGVAASALKAYEQVEYRSDVSLAMAETKLTLRRRVPDEKRLAWARESVASIGDRAPEGMAEIYAREQILLHDEPEVELKLQAIRIGGLGITALPDEVYGITGLKLKARSPLTPTFNIELANGAEGYIPPPEQHKLGGYTTWAARTAGLEVEAEPKIVDALVGLLEKVSGKPPRRPADPPSDYAEGVLASEPAAFWRLGEIEDTRTTDTTDNHHARYEDGVALYLPGPAANGLSAGPRGNRAAHFAGGRVSGNVAGLGDMYSAECWVWNGLPNDARPVTGYFFSRGPNGDERAAGDHLGIGGTYRDGWQGKLIVFNGNERNEVLVGSAVIEPNTWNHVVLTRDGDRVAVYLNGNQKPVISGQLGISRPVECEQVFLGGRNDGMFNLEGKLDEFALYDRVLSGEEIAAHFAAAGRPVANKEAANAANVSPQPLSPQPLSPQQSLDALHIREGFEVELVAAEPLVVDPVAIDWGADGKLWVVEMADYPLGIDGEGKPGGRVRFLEDTDDDGHYDTSTLFLEGVSFPTGILAWGEGVLVTAAPEIFYAEDSDDDGKADLQRPLFAGFLEGNQQLRVNGLRWGLDNWVYCASGRHHAGYGTDNELTSLVTGEKIQVGSRDFRIRPDLGLLDPQSGPSQFGRNRDDWGNWFGVQNSHPLWHYVLDDGYIRRNPHVASPDPRHQVVTPTNPRVYPAKPPQKRFHSFEQSGRFTSACSAMIYRDELLFPRDREQHAFTCEPFHNVVQHNVISDDGVSFGFHRDPAEAEVDFFASEDRWCRPVMVRTGPDGALWIVDMYRYMIEHPQWLPQEGQDELRPHFRAGDRLGRIYRIVPKGHQSVKTPRLDHLDTNELVAALESSNGWQRDTAQRLLVRRGDVAAVAALGEMAVRGRSPLARLHALATLDGLDALTASTIEIALEDSHPGMRRWAVRLAAERPVDVAPLAAMVDDADAKVRLQLACTLGYYDEPHAAAALATLASRDADEPFITAAVMSSINANNLPQVLAAVTAPDNTQRPPDRFISELFAQTVSVRDDQLIVGALATAYASTSDRRDSWQFGALAELLDALAKQSWPIQQGLDTAQQAALATAIEQGREVVADPSAPEVLRAAAAGMLLRRPQHHSEDIALVEQLLVPQTPPRVQQAIVAHSAHRSHPEIADVLLAGWGAHGPALRAQILSVVASRDAWVDALLERLESQEVLAGAIDAPMRQRLLATEDATRRRRLEQVFAASTTTDRQQVLAKYQPALMLSGDRTRGEVVFGKVCTACHRHGEAGHEVGPNLVSLTSRTPESLLASILDPSAAVEATYLNYVVVTDEGRSLAGMLATETGSSITLLAAEGKRESILRSEIEELQSTSKSLMPDGLEQDLTTQDMADLIEFVRLIGTTPQN